MDDTYFKSVGSCGVRRRKEKEIKMEQDRIETTIDDIIDLVLSDQNVEQLNYDHAPVSPETWLAVKTQLLALLAETTEEKK